MKAVRLVIEGRVQGVGFRAWVDREARARQLAGWVRNLSGGGVETVLCGDDAVVDDMVIACNRGPRLANVRKVMSEPAAMEAWRGFEVRATE